MQSASANPEPSAIGEISPGVKPPQATGPDPVLRTSDSPERPNSASHLLSNRFRCADPLRLEVSPGHSGHSGYFNLGPDVICYGSCSSGPTAKNVSSTLHDAYPHVALEGSTVRLPFDPGQVIDNIRSERYSATGPRIKTLPGNTLLRSIYYCLRPLMRVSFRKHFQKFYFRGWDKIPFPSWPVDRTVEDIFERVLAFSMKAHGIGRLPFIWFWPEGAPTCTLMTHDVETAAGRDFCGTLMDLNDLYGVKSAFQVVPEKRYEVSPQFLDSIRSREFEVNVHDLNHDGFLMSDHERFLQRAEQINAYGRAFHARGFRSAIMYRNIDWYDALDFDYDMSIPNMAHLDPQQGGCCTMFPFFIGNMVELPLTTTQDYSLFNILNDYSIRLWKEQVALIRERHGLISFIIHPDYVIEQSARRIYIELLKFIAELRSEGQTWVAKPGDVAAWWRMRSRLNLVQNGGSWRIEGEGSERATLAYAVLHDGKLSYDLSK